jgi:hypothetical protein
MRTDRRTDRHDEVKEPVFEILRTRLKTNITVSIKWLLAATPLDMFICVVSRVVFTR